MSVAGCLANNKIVSHLLVAEQEDFAMPDPTVPDSDIKAYSGFVTWRTEAGGQHRPGPNMYPSFLVRRERSATIAWRRREDGVIR
ncbi:estrogen-related receptor gamma-like protein [Lates japonicus]|uniref:Estrogen-related receptor gamma-like protein n=1 Tax=Lates japonicus TaxID=270547 RepID=A0AAD3NCS9_LATJO|nr:estrogen-related receptor gamma-like protein [Lates japonicus]